MWSDWLVFSGCGFQSVCPLMEKDKRLMEASWWERLTEGELGLVLVGGAVLSKSLIHGVKKSQIRLSNWTKLNWGGRLVREGHKQWPERGWERTGWGQADGWRSRRSVPVGCVLSVSLTWMAPPFLQNRVDGADGPWSVSQASPLPVTELCVCSCGSHAMGRF